MFKFVKLVFLYISDTLTLKVFKFTYLKFIITKSVANSIYLLGGRPRIFLRDISIN